MTNSDYIGEYQFFSSTIGKEVEELSMIPIYTKMLERVSLLSKNDSSNFDIFMKRLSTSDVSWIDDINKLL